VNGDAVLQDNKPIQLQRVAVHDGIVEIELSEEPNLVTTSAIQIDGATATWVLGDDRYTLKSANPFAPGSHALAIGTTLADLNGGTLAEAFTANLSVAVHENRAVFEAPDPREIAASTIGNLFGFQGLPMDPETGLIYVRNRYYDPELGRFISVDPKGYIDGPSMYAFEIDDPENGSDPMGTCNKGESRSDCLKRAGKETLKTVVDFGGGVAQGIAGSVTWNLLPGAQPKDTDSKAQRVGQIIGSAITFVGGASATLDGLVITGGACAVAVGTAGLATPLCLGAAGATAIAGSTVVGASVYMKGLSNKGTASGESKANPNAEHHEAEQPKDKPKTKQGGKITEPELPKKTVAAKGEVEVVHYTKSGDHGPPHLHVKGGGPETKIGQAGKPLKGEPPLTSTQRGLVEEAKSEIRKAVDQIGRWFRFDRQ
jgi:RHS repeat-associated protein